MTPMDPIKKLTKLARTLGGRITSLPKERFEEIKKSQQGLPYSKRTFFEAPFPGGTYVGVSWRRKEVLYAEGLCAWPHLIHELAHALVCHDNPDQAGDEFDFFGWEVVVARLVGPMAEWEYANRHYNVTNDGDDLASYSRAQKDALYEERIARAEKLGLLKNGVPVAIR